jgi:hypothetical protein
VKAASAARGGQLELNSMKIMDDWNTGRYARREDHMCYPTRNLRSDLSVSSWILRLSTVGGANTNTYVSLLYENYVLCFDTPTVKPIGENDRKYKGYVPNTMTSRLRRHQFKMHQVERAGGRFASTLPERRPSWKQATVSFIDPIKLCNFSQCLSCSLVDSSDSLRLFSGLN